MAESKIKKPVSGEQSHLQVPGGAYVYFMGQYQLPQYVPAAYDVYRNISKVPTVALARDVILNEVLQAKYEFVGEEVSDLRVRTVQDIVEPMLEATVRNACLGMIDYGWAPMEVVWEDFNPIKIKSLLVDMSWILIGEKVKDGTVSGEHIGIRQGNIFLYQPNYLLFSFRPEGSMWYGRCILENIRKTYTSYLEAQLASDRYSQKIAGSHWVIHYPRGQSLTKDGTVQDNAIIADTILQNIESNGRMRFEQPTAEFLNDMGKDPKWTGWHVEMIESQQAGQDYVTILAHIEKQLVRGMGIPERALLEAQKSASMADSQTHTEKANLISMELTQNIYNTINKQLIDPILYLNYGESAVGSIKLLPEEVENEDDEIIVDESGVGANKPQEEQDNKFSKGSEK
jgi:hypothetical protein